MMDAGATKCRAERFCMTDWSYSLRGRSTTDAYARDGAPAVPAGTTIVVRDAAVETGSKYRWLRADPLRGWRRLRADGHLEPARGRDLHRMARATLWAALDRRWLRERCLHAAHCGSMRAG